MALDVSPFVVAALTMPVSHYLTCIVICCIEQTGRWDKYRLYDPTPAGRRPVSTYLKPLPRSFLGLCVLLPLALYLVWDWCTTQAYSDVDWSPVNAVVCLGKLGVAYLAGLCYATGVHAMLHRFTWLYTRVHARHHVSPKVFVATTSFEETVWEFLLQDLPGLFIVGPIVAGGLPPTLLVLLYCFQGFIAAVDHSGFRHSWCDGQFHYEHHIKGGMHHVAEHEILQYALGLMTKR